MEVGFEEVKFHVNAFERAATAGEPSGAVRL
jgi:hypothetical protein